MEAASATEQSSATLPPRRARVRGVTIDDRRTRDIDDAIWLEPADDGWRVLVSIADVSRFVTRDEDIDRLAYERVETRYFATGNSPMLPRELSEDACSLWPLRARKTVTVAITLAADLAVADVSLSRSRLRSAAKLGYDAIPGILADKTAPPHHLVKTAAKVAVGLLERRRRAGALALYDLNEGWVTTEEGHLRQVARREDTIGQVIVQEFMILANAAVAEYAVAHDIPVPFRNHKARAAAPDRAVLLQQLADAAHMPLATLDRLREQTHLLLCRAEYGSQLEGHYGLNLPAYLHFTSPVRRYADLVTHRQIVAHLRGEPLPYDRAAIAALAAHINDRLRAYEVETSRAFKREATARATAALDARRVHGLGPKAFERVVKVAVRAGGGPPDGFVDAYCARLADGRVPLLCQTVALGEAPATAAWQALRSAILERLARHPEDAVSILAQATTVCAWPAVAFAHEESGEPHARTFRVIAALGDVVSDPVDGSSLKVAQQRAAVAVLAQKMDLAVPAFPPEAPRAVAGTSKNAVSAVQEHAQAHALAPPMYAFTTEGPSHLPVIRCACTYRGQATTGTATSKQEAKRLAAEAMLAAIGMHPPPTPPEVP